MVVIARQSFYNFNRARLFACQRHSPVIGNRNIGIRQTFNPIFKGLQIMSSTNTFESLQKSSFFSDFSAEDLKQLAEIGRVDEFPARSTVFEEYEPAKEVYVIVSGEVSLAICEPDATCKQIAVVHAGDLLGWSPLVGRTRLYDTAYAMTPVKALVFDGAALMKFCSDNPSFGFQFMSGVARTLAERLGSTRMQLLEMCGFKLPQVPIETD